MTDAKVTVAELPSLSALELLDAYVANRLPAHITVRALLELVHKALKAQSISLMNQQVGRALRPRPSLGWVNAYAREDERLIVSSMPYKTKDEAEAAKTSQPVSKYLGAMELFGVVPRAYHADNCAALTPHDISPWLCNCGFEAQFEARCGTCQQPITFNVLTGTSCACVPGMLPFSDDRGTTLDDCCNRMFNRSNLNWIRDRFISEPLYPRVPAKSLEAKYVPLGIEIRNGFGELEMEELLKEMPSYEEQGRTLREAHTRRFGTIWERRDNIWYGYAPGVKRIRFDRRTELL